jgi:hypothetical protein
LDSATGNADGRGALGAETATTTSCGFSIRRAAGGVTGGASDAATFSDGARADVRGADDDATGCAATEAGTFSDGAGGDDIGSAIEPAAFSGGAMLDADGVCHGAMESAAIEAAAFSDGVSIDAGGAADKAAPAAARARKRLPGVSPAHAPGYTSRTTLNHSSASSRVAKYPMCKRKRSRRSSSLRLTKNLKRLSSGASGCVSAIGVVDEQRLITNESTCAAAVLRSAASRRAVPSGAICGFNVMCLPGPDASTATGCEAAVRNNGRGGKRAHGATLAAPPS